MLVEQKMGWLILRRNLDGRMASKLRVALHDHRLAAGVCYLLEKIVF